MATLTAFVRRICNGLVLLGTVALAIPGFVEFGRAQTSQPQTIPQSESAPPQPVFALTFEFPATPGVDLRPYVAAVSAVLRHSWPAKIQDNLIVRSDKGIVFVQASILRNGSLLEGSPSLELSSGIPKLDDASLATVRASMPFDPLPESFKDEKLPLRIIFRYGYLPDAPFKDIYSAAQREVGNQNYTSAAQLLESLVAKDSDYTNAWNYLGWVYNKLGKYDKAAEALKKAIVVNPRDPNAYNNLGQAYAYLKRYDEAVPQYLKQLEINKKDRYAGANLGRVYIELKQYDKAVSVLEEAATAAPNDPSLFYHLGRAYARIGQSDKAKGAFKKSVDLEPIPMRFNNVAYQMAIANLDLPTAQHYVESGLGVLMPKMRDTSLEQVGTDDTRMAASISYLWGTLGFILFQEGKRSEGEKYLRSSWMLRTTGQNGYDLGCLYEAEGRNDDAVRIFELSLATAQANPEAREHLAKLLPGGADVDKLVEQRRPELTEIRSVSIPNGHGADGVAEFWILFSPGPRVLGAKFIAGDEVLRPFTKDLESATYLDIFPEATEIRLLRRGRLACVPGSPCRLLLASAEAVRTED